MTAAELYAARIDAVRAQRARLHGAPPDDPWGGQVARRFRYDPHRSLDANLALLASYMRPEDVLIEVDAGAWQHTTREPHTPWHLLPLLRREALIMASATPATPVPGGST